MYLLSFKKEQCRTWGVVEPKKNLVFPASQIFSANAPTNLLDFIRGYGMDIKDLKFKICSLEGIPLDQVKILPPITNPIRNIFCVGKNYLDHIIEVAKADKSNQRALDYPTFFTKATNTLSGPYEPVSLHNGITQQVDYEAELAVIIGRRGRDISIENAMDYVFGYTILNDVTARDLQKNHNQWHKGKSLDGFCPLGPWIVTRDEISEPLELNITSYVNDEVRQNSNTRHMIFNIAELISQLSTGLTLEPGDILATGTPAGVGIGFEPPKFLKKGDVVKIEIEKIGTIENPFE